MSRPQIDQQITFLYTSDLQSTAHFYEEVIGLVLSLDQGACRIYRTGIDSYLGFCQRENTPSEHENIIFTLVTRYVEEWYQYLLGHGVTFEKPPAINRKFMIYHCTFRDVNGYLIEIQRFIDDDWYKSPERS